MNEVQRNYVHQDGRRIVKELRGGGMVADFYEWLENAFLDFLAKWGLWRKQVYVLFLGLDNAGKTTLIGVLRKYFLL